MKETVCTVSEVIWAARNDPVNLHALVVLDKVVYK